MLRGHRRGNEEIWTRVAQGQHSTASRRTLMSTHSVPQAPGALSPAEGRRGVKESTHPHPVSGCSLLEQLRDLYSPASMNRRLASSGMLRRMAIARTDVSEERTASIIRVTRIGELRTLAVTSHRFLSP
jgi:hypothetical protein